MDISKVSPSGGRGTNSARCRLLSRLHQPEIFKNGEIVLTTTTAARSIADKIFRGLIIVSIKPATPHGDFALGTFFEGIEFLLILWGGSISYERSTRTGETHRAPSGAGGTPAQAFNVQSQTGVAGPGGVLAFVALLSSYPAGMAPQPVAAAVRASCLGRVGLWVYLRLQTLRLQTEGSSADHVQGWTRCIRESLGSRKRAAVCTRRGTRGRGRSGLRRQPGQAGFMK